MIIDACKCAISATGLTANHFTERWFSECQYNGRMTASYVFGLISLACWVCVASPQLILQMFKQRADGISLLFLILWLSGDVTYVISTSLAGALPTTQFLAIWYIISDVLVDTQTVWYVFFRPRLLTARRAAAELGRRGIARRPVPGESADTAQQRAEVLAAARTEVEAELAAGPNKNYSRGAMLATTWSLVAAAVVAALMYLITQGVNRNSMPAAWITRECGSGGSKDTSSAAYIVGQVFGYINIPLFVGSRPAQIWKNWKRKSTENVSPFFFLLTLMGNITQALSIFINDPTPTGESYGAYLTGQAPYICSSAGIAAFDVVILVQVFLYKGQKPLEVAPTSAQSEVTEIADGVILGDKPAIEVTSSAESTEIAN